MKIGLLSDTHGDHVRAGLATRELLKHPIEAVFHCGDIGSERVLAELASACQPRGVPVHAVLGNVDLYEDALEDFPHETGVRVWGRRAVLELAGKQVAVIHGDDIHMLGNAVSGQQYDYIFTGHTHVHADEREGRTRIINPGAIFRGYPPTVAVLDLATGLLECIALA